MRHRGGAGRIGNTMSFYAEVFRKRLAAPRRAARKAPSGNTKY